MEGENPIEDRGFLGAPVTFFLVVVFQLLLSKWLDQLKKVNKITKRSAVFTSKKKYIF